MLVSGTLAENITLGRQDGFGTGYLTELISRFFGAEVGAASELGEMGSHLSGGQQQRASLMRALYGHPPLLVLDEPTASLDAENELKVISAISEAKRWATVIVASHSPGVLDIADQIISLAGGTACVHDKVHHSRSC